MLVADPLCLVGSTLAHKYVIDSIVRVEALAVVYRATQRIVNRAVAVRVFTSLAKVPGDRRKALYHELVQDEHKLAELAPLVPAVYPARDVETIVLQGGKYAGDWVPYVILDWPHGVTLRQLMVDAPHMDPSPYSSPRTMPEVVALLEPVAVALAIAHEHGVVHAGVTPDHVLFTDEDAAGKRRARLLDFGVAKLLRGRTHEAGSSGAFPVIDARTDVAAFAQLLLDLFAASNGATASGASPRARGLTVSDEVEAVFTRALAARFEERFATVGELWSALRRALDLPRLQSMTTTLPPEVPASQSGGHTASSLLPTSFAPMSRTFPPGAPRSRAMLAGASFLALAAVASFAVVYTRSNEPGLEAAASPVPSIAPLAASSASSASAAARACPSGMIDIPGGAFVMGADEGLELEKPAHRVTLSRYCIDRFEVTTQDYKSCSDRGECVRAARANVWGGIAARDHAIYDPLCNARDPEGRAKHPINCVSWENAAAYCARGGKRLPTEAEWELAARGPEGRRYPWGDQPPAPALLNACGKECRAWSKKSRVDDLAMYEADDGWMHTAPVGSFPAGASRYGALDMGGNVWEWVGDWYAPYMADESIDPPGPAQPAGGEKRVMRGGAWNGAHEAWVRTTFRFGGDPQMRSHAVGFRCASGF